MRPSKLGEHQIYQYELARRGSLERINMQWSLADCAYDCAANGIGWLLATAWYTTRIADETCLVGGTTPPH